MADVNDRYKVATSVDPEVIKAITPNGSPLQRSLLGQPQRTPGEIENGIARQQVGLPVDVTAVPPALHPDNAVPVLTTPPPSGAINPDIDAPTDSATPGGTPAAKPFVGPPQPSATGPGVVDLREEKTTTTSVDPAKDAKAEKAADAFIRANTAAADLQASEYTMASAENTLKAQQMQRDIDAENDRRTEENNRLQAEQDKVQAQMDAYQQMKLDPSRLWSNLGTGDKVLAGFAMMLGAFGAGAQGAGAQNLAVQAIDKAIDRDIDAQKVNMDKAGKNVEFARTIYQDMRQKFGDDRLARSAMREMVYSQLATEAQARAEAAKAPILKANAEAANKEFLAKTAQESANRATIVTEKAKTQKPVTANQKPPVELYSREEAEKIAGYNSALKTADTLEGYLSDPNVQKQMGPVNEIIGRFQEKWGMDRDPEMVKAALEGNLMAKAYLKAMSGQGVTDKERQNAFDTIMPTLNQSPKVALARLQEFRNNQLSDRDTIVQGVIHRYGDDPRTTAAVMSQQYVPLYQRKKNAGFKKAP